MSDLKEYRKQIDTIDSEITSLLQKRLDVVSGIAEYKMREGMPVLDAAREKEKIQTMESLCSEEKAPYIAETFRSIMAESRRFQHDHMQEYGLLGWPLGHSYSPQIHKSFGRYDYGLFETRPEQLEDFFREGRFKGISVTMPYKRDVMRFCSEMSSQAVRCDSVNTIVKRSDGTYYGDNTDYYGFESTVRSSGISVKGKKTLVLGSGGVSGTVVKVMEDLGADPVIIISRKGENNYDNLDRHYDARIVINATPVGMYPKAGTAAVDIARFTECQAVFDLIYNPLRTKLMLDAARAGIPAFGGFQMLAAQAAKACQLFLGEKGESIDPKELTELAMRQIRGEVQNIVLIGMPGCGKTTMGREIAQLTGKAFVDCDAYIEEQTARPPEQIIREDGVEKFREIESEVIRSIMRRGPQPDGHTPGIVFATGGGCVEREENRVPLLENSLVVYLQRELADLPVDGRPVSQKDGLEAVFERRRDRYENWSDVCVSRKSR